jgi:alkylation response protein AidB-like acyl-CoA dehydrogenase
VVGNWRQSDGLHAAREIATSVIRPHAETWDRDATWPEPAVRALQAAGLGGLVVPEAFGGKGQGLLALLETCEVLGSEDASSGLCFGMHCVATACIAAKVSPGQGERLLVPIAQGRHWTTLALSEPGSGSHFYLPQTVMAPSTDGASYTLTGQKCFVTNGGHADSYVVSAVSNDEAAPPGHFSLLLVPANATGLSWGAAWAGWGMRGNSSAALGLDRVSVRATDRLGSEGDQIWYVFSIVAPYFLVAMAGTYLGVAEHALSEATAHLKRRHYAHSGGSLAEVSVLQHRLGTLWARLNSTRQLCRWAAATGDHGGEHALEALCSAKAEVARTAVDITNDCMSLAGGQGYRDGAVLQRLLRDARAAEVMSPTTDILYTWIGRSLLGLPLLGE